MSANQRSARNGAAGCRAPGICSHLVSNQREFLARLALRRLLYCFQTLTQQASLGTALIEGPAEHKDQQRNQEENRDGNQDWHMFTSYSAISLASELKPPCSNRILQGAAGNRLSPACRRTWA